MKNSTKKFLKNSSNPGLNWRSFYDPETDNLVDCKSSTYNHNYQLFSLSIFSIIVDFCSFWQGITQTCWKNTHNWRCHLTNFFVSTFCRRFLADCNNENCTLQFDDFFAKKTSTFISYFRFDCSERKNCKSRFGDTQVPRSKINTSMTELVSRAFRGVF